VFKGLNCLQCNAFYHTHIGTEGKICWGSAKRRAQQGLYDRKYSETFSLLHSLLHTYCPENPYIRLSTFDTLVRNTFKSGIRRQGDFTPNDYPFIPGDLPVDVERKPEWDTESPLAVGQLVLIRGNFDMGNGAEFNDYVALVYRLKRKGHSVSQISDKENICHSTVLIGKKAGVDKFGVGDYRENSTGRTRDELEPISGPILAQFEAARTIFHKHKSLFIGDEVIVVDGSHSGNSSRLGKKGIVVRIQGLFSYYSVSSGKWTNSTTRGSQDWHYKVALEGETSLRTFCIRDLQPTNPKIKDVFTKRYKIKDRRSLSESSDGQPAVQCDQCDSTNIEPSNRNGTEMPANERYCRDCSHYISPVAPPVPNYPF
jgi:hypothetical protein